MDHRMSQNGAVPLQAYGMGAYDALPVIFQRTSMLMLAHCVPITLVAAGRAPSCCGWQGGTRTCAAWPQPTPSACCPASTLRPSAGEHHQYRSQLGLSLASVTEAIIAATDF